MRQNMSFPKLLRTESVNNSTRAAVLWRAVPNFVLVFGAFEVPGKFLFACCVSIAHSAVQIVRLRGSGFFWIILQQDSWDSTIALQFIFLPDTPWREASKMASTLTQVVTKCSSALPTPALFICFLASRRDWQGRFTFLLRKRTRIHTGKRIIGFFMRRH